MFKETHFITLSPNQYKELLNSSLFRNTTINWKERIKKRMWDKNDSQ